MKNILKIIFITLLIKSSVLASVVAKVDYDKVEVGDMVTYSLEISGEDITRPIIQRLCGTDVISTASNTSMQIINGQISRSYILSYKFIPQKSCKIEPMLVEIDGKKEYSNEVNLVVSKVTGAKDKEFELKLSVDKKDVLVGESFNLTLIFKHKKNAKAVDSKFVPPDLKGFWVKKESRPIKYEEGAYNITKLTYTLAAQREGKQHISKAQMRIAKRSSQRDSWGSFIPNIRWKTYFSNEIDIDVKALPSGVSLVGDFKISAKVDKTEVNANEAVNVEIKVLGDGNLEDIESFKPFIEDVSVFDEKINVQGLKLTQKIAFVAESSYVIPSFSIKYFDTKTKKVKTISTKEIAIDVKGSKLKKEELVIKKDKTTSKEEVGAKSLHVEADMPVLILTFASGLLVGVFIMFFIKPFGASSKKDKAVSLKDPRTLLMRLLPYRDDIEVQSIVEKLEESIYSSKELDIDKKQLKEIFKRLDL